MTLFSDIAKEINKATTQFHITTEEDTFLTAAGTDSGIPVYAVTIKNGNATKIVFSTCFEDSKRALTLLQRLRGATQAFAIETIEDVISEYKRF